MAITHYTWDPLSENVLMESDEGGATTAKYTNEPDQYGRLISQRREGATSFYHYDGQATTRQLTDANQNVTDTSTYSAFGETVDKTGSTTNPFGFKGALGYYANPDTDDVYVRARTYEPRIGRWLSVDPLGLPDSESMSDSAIDAISADDFESFSPVGQGWTLYKREGVMFGWWIPRNRIGFTNLFLYANNSPVDFVDPSGLVCVLGPQCGDCKSVKCKKKTCTRRKKGRVSMCWGGFKPPKRKKLKQCRKAVLDCMSCCPLCNSKGVPNHKLLCCQECCDVCWAEVVSVCGTNQEWNIKLGLCKSKKCLPLAL